MSSSMILYHFFIAFLLSCSLYGNYNPFKLLCQ
nr:MAG TPA: hypothetical protein [Caudoviricetes sp.]